METPARFTFSPDGNTKVFPIPVTMKGDNYVRIDIDGVILNDRSKFDLVNNAVVFVNLTDVPSGSQLDVLVVQTDEGISNLGNVNSVDLVASNITDVQTVAGNIASVNTTATNIAAVNTTATNIASVIDAVNQANAAAASAAAALVSENAAAASESAADASETAAAASAAASATSASNSASSASAALASQTAAATSETNAAASAAASSTSATSSANSATASAASAAAALVSQNAAAASETAAAASEAAASTSETNAAASETAAAASQVAAASSQTAAAASAAAALVSENNAATSETAAAASETAAAASETAAAASEAAAATSEANAAASETAAATSETNAANSATASASSASAAAVSATNAATSETNAATSAAAASASQVAAAASAASAANSYDLFDDRYLGTKASDPTLDNDGNPLVAGALYFNSTANEMRVYDGGNWIAASSAGGASLLKYEFTATSGQTVFSGADDNGATLSYVQDNMMLFLNGVALDDVADYTATDGTSIVLTSGATAGDLLYIIAFKSFTTADMVAASTGGTFYNDIAVQGQITTDALQLTGGTGTQGTFSWNTDEETVDLIQDGATLQLGQEVQWHCRNNTGSTILNGTPVMATGTLGTSGRITIAPMVSTTQSNAKYFIGIATEDIAAGTDGKVTHFGKVRGIDTSGFAEGAVLWLSTTTDATLTATEPTSGMKIACAFVLTSHATNGTLAVRVSNAESFDPNTLGTAALEDVGTSAGNVVQLDASARLPAVDGSQLTGIVSIPTGLISMWSGSIASIPSGWVLCDGNNGTPNLMDRFVVGAGSSYAVGATGGAATVALSATEIPSHTHSFSGSGNTSNSGNHAHNGSTSNTGAHTHSYDRPYDPGTGQGNNPYSAKITAGTTGSSGAHSHNFTTAGGGDHSHSFSVSGTTGATGSGSAHENRPPYYALAYIMKT